MTVDKTPRMWYTMYVSKGTERQTPTNGKDTRVVRLIDLRGSAANPLNRNRGSSHRGEERAGGVWQSAFLTPRTVANVAIPEEPRPYRLIIKRKP